MLFRDSEPIMRVRLDQLQPSDYAVLYANRDRGWRRRVVNMLIEESQEGGTGNGLLGGCRSTKTRQRICQSRLNHVARDSPAISSMERAVVRGSEVVKIVSWMVFNLGLYTTSTKKSQAIAKPHE